MRLNYWSGIFVCILYILGMTYSDTCYIDSSCVGGGLGCNANGKQTCRFCGGTGDYASITCPNELSNCCNTPRACPHNKTEKIMRTFQLRNNCDYDLYVGIIGQNTSDASVQWAPRKGGFKLPAMTTDEVHLPNGWSGRVWPRTNCRYNETSQRFYCDSGDCASSVNDEGANGYCCGDIKCAAAKSASVAEFTLATNSSTGNDFYDVSLVDGYTIPLSIIPYDSDGSCGGNATYYCKQATINEFDVANVCPPELRWSGTGEYSYMQFCASICVAVNSKELREKTSFINDWGTGASAIGGSGTNYTATHHGPMLDFLCCRCSVNGGNCTTNDNDHCAFGCTPHPYKANAYWPANKRCTMVNGTGFPDWPYSKSGGFENTHYARMFKSSSPTAYSWQFDDPTSTYQCSNTHYRIEFCAAKTTDEKTKSAAALKNVSQFVWCAIVVLATVMHVNRII